jgi:hypothetical protein
VAKI